MGLHKINKASAEQKSTVHKMNIQNIRKSLFHQRKGHFLDYIDN